MLTSFVRTAVQALAGDKTFLNETGNIYLSISLSLTPSTMMNESGLVDARNDAFIVQVVMAQFQPLGHTVVMYVTNNTIHSAYTRVCCVVRLLTFAIILCLVGWCRLLTGADKQYSL